MDKELGKALFYAGRTGDKCTDILLIAVCTHLGIHWLSTATRRLSPAVRIVIDLLVLPVFLFILIWKPSIWFCLLGLPLLFDGNDRTPDVGRDQPLAVSRLTTLLLTTISIIFVDFPDFPEGHAKVSHHLVVTAQSVRIGDLTSFDDPWNRNKVHLSLMDCGASYFLILNGFSSLAPLKSLIHSLINLALWGARIVLTKSANYFTPEGEYSANCNFFGYVGAVQLIAAVCSLLHIPSGVLAIVGMVVHELSGNAFPFLGYVTLFFIANAIGYSVPQNWNYWLHLAFWFLPTLLAELELIHPLREKANAEFSLFCFSNFYFTLVMGRRYRIPYAELSELCIAIDRYPLVFFLGANVATGLINLTIDANHSSLAASFASSLLVFWVASVVTLIPHGLIRWFKRTRG
jgi:hypothetical protein